MKNRLLLLIAFFVFTKTFAATLLPNFNEKRILDNLDATGMTILTDNRILITEKGGGIWLVKQDETAKFIFKIPNVDTYFERGLQNVVADPDFNKNGHVYFYYTFKDLQNSISFNRVIRYSLINDSLDTSSSKIIFDLPTLNAGNHNGGGMVFGKDKKLYVSTGDNAISDNSQIQDNLFGKILRLNSDGSIPTDNPFYTSNTNLNKAVYALGLRNPFKLKINTINDQIIINEVGQNTWEEINILSKASNYGWPLIEGVRNTQTPPINYIDPIFSYDHANGNCSITGGTFYSPNFAGFPSTYFGKYFFMDYCAGTISFIDPQLSSQTANTFATGLKGAVDMDCSADGNIYYLQRGAISNNATAGELWKISYSNSGNVFISVQPQDKIGSINNDIQFSVQASGSDKITYQWYKNNIEIDSSNTPTLLLKSVSLKDNGAKFKVKVSNTNSFEISKEVILTVLNNHAPVAQILTPHESFLYEGGITLNFSGSAQDEEDGDLPETAFSWKIDFHHNTHIHPGLDLVSGIKSGSLLIPNEGETSDNVWYRIHLTVTDKDGASSSIYKDIFPKKAEITIQTNPIGIPVLLDGSPIQTPFTFMAVVGVKRTIETPFYYSLNYENNLFQNWNSGNKSTKVSLIVPEKDSAFTANYINVKIDTLSPISDTYVRSDSHANTIFGIEDSTHLLSKNDLVNENTNREIYIRFPLPKYENALASFVQLHGAKENTTQPNVQVNVYGLTDTIWQEKTLTWNSKPNQNLVVLDSQFVSNVTQNEYKWNVTTFTQDETSMDKNSLSFVLSNPISTPTTYVQFNSKEASENKPKLIVFYDSKIVNNIWMQNEELNELIVSPNPIHYSQTLKIKSKEPINNLLLYNLMGEVINPEIDNLNGETHLKNLTKGIYFLHIHTTKNKIVKKLLVK